MRLLRINTTFIQPHMWYPYHWWSACGLQYLLGPMSVLLRVYRFYILRQCRMEEHTWLWNELGSFYFLFLKNLPYCVTSRYFLKCKREYLSHFLPVSHITRHILWNRRNVFQYYSTKSFRLWIRWKINENGKTCFFIDPSFLGFRT